MADGTGVGAEAFATPARSNGDFTGDWRAASLSRARHAWRRDLAFAQSAVEIARARAFAARLGASMVHLPRNLSAYRREWRRVRFERRRAATERGAVLGPFGGRHRTSRRCRPRPQPQHRHLALELRQKPWLCHS